MSKKPCICEERTDEFHGWKCLITEDPCMYSYPDQRACANAYGEVPPPEDDE